MKPFRMLLVNVGYHTRMFPLVTPPMGLMALAAYLRERLPVEPLIINQRLENTPIEEVVRRGRDFGPDVIGLSVFTTSAYLLPEMARQMRAAFPGKLIMVGGPHASGMRADVFRNSDVDVVVPGEGEITADAVLRAWDGGGRNFDGIPGLLWKNAQGEIVQNPGCLPQIEELDSLPMPAYDLIDLPRYWKIQSIAPIFRRRYASLVSSRGCTYQCIWCHRIFGKAIRMHSPERVVEEMAFLHGKYRAQGLRDFEFLDDNFNFRPQRVLDICDGLHKRGMKIKLTFPTGLRADLLNPQVIDALVDTGMQMCGFALETASPRLQKFTCKQLNIPKMLASAEHAVRRGVFMNLFCMLGFPTETEEEIRQTIQVAYDSAVMTASFYTVTPFPGTELYEMIKREHPEVLTKLRYDDMDFSGMKVNLTDLPDEKLFYYQRMALRKFYSKPSRIYRIVRHHPQSWLLPAYVPIFVYRATKGMFAKKTVQAASLPVSGGGCPPAS